MDKTRMTVIANIAEEEVRDEVLSALDFKDNIFDFIAEHDVSIMYALEHKDMTMLEDIFAEVM
jgi:hypothetical protein